MVLPVPGRSPTRRPAGRSWSAICGRLPCWSAR